MQAEGNQPPGEIEKDTDRRESISNMNATERKKGARNVEGRGGRCPIRTRGTPDDINRKKKVGMAKLRDKPVERAGGKRHAMKSGGSSVLELAEMLVAPAKKL